MHPELILDIGNVLVVVSSRKPEVFASLISRRLDLADLADDLVDARMKALGCEKEGKAPAALCEALADFKQGAYPARLVDGETVLIGHAWDVLKPSEAGAASFEVLYLAKSDGRLLASYGEITPENDDEREQIQAQIEAQKRGGTAGQAGPLMDFVRGSHGTKTARAKRVGDRSLAFIGLSLRTYVFDMKKPPYIVAVYEVGAEVLP